MFQNQIDRTKLIDEWIERLAGPLMAIRSWQALLIDAKNLPDTANGEAMFLLSEILLDALEEVEVFRAEIVNSDKLEHLFRTVTGEETWPYYLAEQIQAGVFDHDLEHYRAEAEAYRQVDPAAAERLLALIAER